LQTRSGHSIIVGLHFAFANALSGQSCDQIGEGLNAVVQDVRDV
jgi:hypothetical protein